MIDAATKEKRMAKRREDNWKLRGVIMSDGKPLTYIVFKAVEAFQNEGCALCHRNEFWGALHADHDDKTGLFRGVLCADCNYHAVGTYERTKRYRDEEHAKTLSEYLKNPPYRRWLNEGGSIRNKVRRAIGVS